MTRKRIVLDTNVLISAVLSSTSKLSQVIESAITYGQLVASVETLLEFETKVSSEKFRRYVPDDRRNALLLRLAHLTEIVRVVDKVQASRDPKDDKFLEAALNGHADMIVTGDRDLLALNPFRGIAILNPAAYLESFAIAAEQPDTLVVILMGTTGAGKTTAGEILAREMGWEFADADSFHSAANVEKMSKGIGLTDAERKPWLDALRAKIAEWIASGKNAVLACSALKRSYRDELSVGPQVKWVYLKGSYEEIAKRVAERKGHYAKEGLVESQFAVLEEPSDALTVEVNRTPNEIVAEIRKGLGLI